jgi:hypothetical protein
MGPGLQEQIHGDPNCDGPNWRSTAPVPRDAEEVAEAERRFKELTGAGFTAAARTATGESRRVNSFDPTIEETLFFPRLVGG